MYIQYMMDDGAGYLKGATRIPNVKYGLPRMLHSKLSQLSPISIINKLRIIVRTGEGVRSTDEDGVNTCTYNIL